MTLGPNCNLKNSGCEGEKTGGNNFSKPFGEVVHEKNPF